jgi:hypothetical protein
MRQVVTVIPENPPGLFILSIRAFFPSGTVNPTLHVDSIEPDPKVKCTYHGKPAPRDYPSSEVSLTCTKPVNESVSLAVNTNAGTNFGAGGERITIPAQRNLQDATNDRVTQLEARFEALSRAAPPIGTIEAYAGDLDHNPAAEPALEGAGWLPCDGRELSISDAKYTNLYKAIGKSWGGGTNTFNIPDLRGLFLRGLDHEIGRDAVRGSRKANRPGGNTGDLVGTIEPDEVGPHSHPIDDPGHGHDIQKGVLADGSGGYGSGGGGGGSDIHDRHSQPIVLNAYTNITVQSNSGLETRPKNASVNYIIRFN